MASIKLDWSGVTASTGIKGYEISHKESTDSLWTTFPFITSSSSSGTYTWTGAEYNKNYNFRIRTQDNDDLYSIYKTVNISTSISGNLPPETVDSYTLNYVTSDSIDLNFFNASDDFGIKGHEVSYKKVSDSVYTTLPFIATSSGNFYITILGLESSTDYDIRVRTQDIYDVWSDTYFNIEATTDAISINSVQRSISKLNSGSACSLVLSSNELYYSGGLSNGTTMYLENTLTTPFNGAGKIWLVGNLDNSYSVRISTAGVVSNIELCF